MKPTIETGAFLSDEIEIERTWFKRKLRGVFNCARMLSFTNEVYSKVRWVEEV